MSDYAINTANKKKQKQKFTINRRQYTFGVIGLSILILLSVLIASYALPDSNIATNLNAKNLAPSFDNIFGTDWLGRDMFTRTIKGLRLSVAVGALAATISVVLATILALIASINDKCDLVVSWFIDLFLGMPHIVFLILISFAFGGGVKGVVVGVAVTHWPTLTRIVRAEILQIKTADYVKISRHMGKTSWYVATKHILPHIVPQLLIGYLLLFPHAILHEAAITFLGFGLSPHKPAIGIILSESMMYLSTGMWWLAFFPGLALIIVVKLFDVIGENLKMLYDPSSAHE